MKRVCRLFLFLSVLWACASCSEAIDIDTGLHKDGVFVVDGVIMDLECRQTVRLSLTEDFCSPSSDIPWVSGAQVSVSCGDMTYGYEEDPGTPGTYLSVEEFKGETGRTYELDVMAVVDGRELHFRAVDSVPAPGVRLDSIDYIYSKDIPDTWVLAVWGKDYFKMNCRYLLQSGVNGHFRPLDKSVELPDDHFDGMSFSRFGLAALNHTEEMWKAYGDCFKPLERGDVISFRVSTLSEGYGEFLMKYSHFIFGTVPLLTDQPGNLMTNVSGNGPVVGYFGACAVSEASCVVDDPFRTEYRLAK